MKKFISLLIAIVFAFVAIPAYAEDIGVTPYYLHIKLMANGFEIDDQTGEALVDAHITIKSGNSCKAVASVQRSSGSSWTTVSTFRETGTTSATISENLDVSRGYTYKCVFSFTVFDANGNIIEQKSFTSEEIYYA